eukprot:TRINITY_DN47773_c0_g1_i1.p1 TRINITY_DN47773_c0_g1~~TRINITY_DN47773_c0_g1_i1.p1  ORF type:complete len:340 (+),score=60.10 TRINITY_DN47773_c0_g1_i1:201-1220(+)
MPQRFRRRGRNRYSSEEEKAVTWVAAEHHRLLADNKSIIDRDEADLTDWVRFLEELEETVVLQRCDVASRKYRLNFTSNYRALLLEDARRYRADVLQPSMCRQEAIWINGQRFQFSSETLRRAEVLHNSWFELAACLERWYMDGKGQTPCLATRPSRAELRHVLVVLDVAWAEFECAYIGELIEFEHKCRSILRQAIAEEQRLQQLEMVHPGVLHKKELETLLHCLYCLDLEVNHHRNICDDMTVDVLLRATSMLSRYDAVEKQGASTEYLTAACILSKDVMESFMAMRQYLREVSSCLEHVDPHLRNNPGLVAALSSWEESCEIGARYFRHRGAYGCH